MVYKSEDAGDATTWTEVDPTNLGVFVGAWANSEIITSIDVAYVDDVPYVYIGTADPGAYNGDVYFMSDVGFGTPWTALQVDDGAANPTLDVYSVACSPFFADDTEVDALVTDAGYTGVVRNIAGVPGVWQEVDELLLGNVAAFESVVASDIVYVENFCDEYEMFVGVAEVTLAGLGDVFRICGVGCSLILILVALVPARILPAWMWLVVLEVLHW